MKNSNIYIICNGYLNFFNYLGFSLLLYGFFTACKFWNNKNIEWHPPVLTVDKQ